ncbi:hypothetical protein FOMPIDRAFT_1046961 [Fomitopsis schrenkii]|uniref:Peptidyl-prolyl cis-trans isomerase n=1 Tax=Fomitopsis schrenkii TaxID=2126942 RepID=S8EGK3_FOMSC|nr:hypothetical protein FOMPIDRAFT_1046961 [Fomitopsis schrenkii]
MDAAENRIERSNTNPKTAKMAEQLEGARSKEDAIEVLKGYAAESNGSEKFAELASVYSDDSSHAKKGNLGSLGSGKMQKPFEEATYVLEVGQTG